MIVCHQRDLILGTSPGQLRCCLSSQKSRVCHVIKSLLKKCCSLTCLTGGLRGVNLLLLTVYVSQLEVRHAQTRSEWTCSSPHGLCCAKCECKPLLVSRGKRQAGLLSKLGGLYFSQ